MLNFLDKYKFIKGQTAFGIELLYTTKEHFTIVATELTSNKEGIEVSRKLVDISKGSIKVSYRMKFPSK